MQSVCKKALKTLYKYKRFWHGSVLEVNWKKDVSKMLLQWEYDLCYNSIVKKFNKVYNAFEKNLGGVFLLTKKSKGGGLMKNIIYLYVHGP